VHFKLSKFIFFIGIILIGVVILSGAVSAAGLTNSSQPKFHHDDQNTGQSQFKGPATNTTKWNYTTGNTIFSSPAININSTIYIGSMDDNLYAINPNGTKKWSYHTGGSIYSSPAIGSDGTIYFGSDDRKIYALNPNGTLKWKYTTDYAIYSSPAIGSDGTIYVGCFDGNLYAFNPNGTLKWSYNTRSIIVMPPSIGSDGTIYIGNFNDNLYALNPNGTLKWKYTTGSYVKSSPIIGSDGTIYLGSYDYNLYALSSTGILKWKYTAGDSIDSSPAIGSDGTLYFGCYDGNLYAIQDPLIVTATLNGGYYNTTKIITLKTNMPSTIYYTLNGTTPTINSLKYVNPITISTTTILEYLAVHSGVKSLVYSQTYIIDKVPPKISSTSPVNNAINVSLTAPVTIKFTENIIAGPNYSAIYIKNLTTGIIVSLASKIISGNTLTIKTTYNHLSNDTYQVYIPASTVKDKAGNYLTLAYTLKFKTG